MLLFLLETFGSFFSGSLIVIGVGLGVASFSSDTLISAVILIAIGLICLVFGVAIFSFVHRDNGEG